ncbi:MAG: hypothetical protein K6T56_05355 [Burkholderiales bacterium]|nr:hypothetical protein [Burkholderiales bacterium]
MTGLILWLARLCLVLAFGAGPAFAAPSSVAVLLSDEAPLYQEFAQRFQNELLSRGAMSVTVLPPAAAGEAARADLVVSVGVWATEQALRLEPAPPVLAVLLPRASFLKLRAKAGARALSAIFLDQPPGRRFALIAEAFPEVRRVGVVLGPESAAEARSLQAAARERGMILVAERIDEEEALLAALKRVLSEADVLLAVPDSLVFNRNTAQAILLTSYRAQKPVVAYSQAYVQAGALVAVYSTPAQIAQQAAEIVYGLGTPPTLPAAQYPKYFSVAVNAQVARSLGIPVESERVLLERLMGAGGRP